MSSWLPRLFALALAASLVGGCAGSEPQVAIDHWARVDVGSTGDLVVIDASPWAATAVVEYSRVYNSEDGRNWARVETPDMEMAWAGRTATGFVVVGTKGNAIAGAPDDWTECDVVTDGEVYIRDGMVTTEGVFIIGNVDGEFYLWVQAAGNECAWTRVVLPLPTDLGEVSTWAQIAWTDEGLVVYPSWWADGFEGFYWVIDPASFKAELVTGRRPLSVVRRLSSFPRSMEPAVGFETAAGFERLELPVAREEGWHMVGPGQMRDDVMVVVGSLAGGAKTEQEPFREEILQWTRDDNGVSVGTAAFVPGFDVSLYDLVEFNGVWITGGSYVHSGRTPFLLVSPPIK